MEISLVASILMTPSSLSTPMSSAPCPRSVPSTTMTLSFFCGLASSSSASAIVSFSSPSTLSMRVSPLAMVLSVPTCTVTSSPARERTTPCFPPGRTTTAPVMNFPWYPASDAEMASALEPPRRSGVPVTRMSGVPVYPDSPPGVGVSSFQWEVSYAGVCEPHAVSLSGVRPPAPSSRDGVMPGLYAGVVGRCWGVRAGGWKVSTDAEGAPP
mmetsp:Transcript_1208/g.5379  ORF Transcript_1208/g.5379 Transcript_1208/m.5379 type:complete len:212 (+) Transcript_1208:115-750(+)